MTDAEYLKHCGWKYCIEGWYREGDNRYYSISDAVWWQTFIDTIDFDYIKPWTNEELADIHNERMKS